MSLAAGTRLGPYEIVAPIGAGGSLGTAAHVSPEQAKGKRVDRPTDICAFGCVLYETITGNGAIGGEDVSDTLAAVVKDAPDFEAPPAAGKMPVATTSPSPVSFHDSGNPSSSAAGGSDLVIVLDRPEDLKRLVPAGNQGVRECDVTLRW